MSSNVLTMTFNELAIHNRRIDQHRHSRSGWLELHENLCPKAVSYGRKGKALVIERLFKRTTDDRNLISAYEHIGRTSGDVAGPDGCTISGFEEGRYAFARFLRDELRAKRYWPSAPNVIRVRKPSGRGYRKIQIHNILDRIVQRAVVQVLQPFLDPQFLPLSVGYRPRLQRNHALAKAEIWLERGYTAVVTEDLKDAFDSVPQKRLLDILRKYAPEGDFIALLRKLIVTPEGTGIAQGSPLSPLLLNLYLHHTIDRTWTGMKSQFHMIRYADDIALFCPDVDGAATAHNTLNDLVRSAGFRFRDSSASNIKNLSNAETFEWLGYLIGNTFGYLEVNITEGAWHSLEDQIRQTKDSPKCVARSIHGWIDQLGPAFFFENVNQVAMRINSILLEAGTKLQCNPKAIRRRWAQAFQRWEDLRLNVRMTNYDRVSAATLSEFDVPIGSAMRPDENVGW